MNREKYSLQGMTAHLGFICFLCVLFCAVCGCTPLRKKFTRKKKDPKTKRQDKKALEEVEQWYQDELARVEKLKIQKLIAVFEDHTAKSIKDKETGRVLVRSGTALDRDRLSDINFDVVDFFEDISDNKRLIPWPMMSWRPIWPSWKSLMKI